VPVELTSFVSNVIGNSVSLKWTTATEKNNSGFQVERAINTKEWVSIGFVKGNGTKLSPTEYSFVDNTVSVGKYSYRLKQVDYDGSIQFHQLSNEVEVGVPNEFSISQNYPNPFNPATKIDFTVAELATVNIELFDVSGSKVANLYSGVNEPGFYSIMLDIQKHSLSSGNYFYRFTATEVSNGKIFTSMKKMTLLK